MTGQDERPIQATTARIKNGIQKSKNVSFVFSTFERLKFFISSDQSQYSSQPLSGIKKMDFFSGWRAYFLRGTALISAFDLIGSSPAQAQDFFSDLAFFNHIAPHSAVGFAIFFGLVVFSTAMAIRYVQERQRWTRREIVMIEEISHLQNLRARADILLRSEHQLIVSWEGHDAEPVFEGDSSIIDGNFSPRRILAFGSWLSAADAQKLDHVLDKLKARGESFRLMLRAPQGRYIEAEGRAHNGRVTLRLRDVTGAQLAYQREREAHEELAHRMASIKALLDAIPYPIWQRHEGDCLAWVNQAYTTAVEASDAALVHERGIELLDRAAREEAARLRKDGQTYHDRVPAIVAGARCTLDVFEIPTDGWASGIAIDVTEIESIRLEHERQMAAHVRTLDQLSTAVAIFDRKQNLVFHNAAYRQLWKLDQAFLDQKPSDSEILDRLRAERKLPEQADFKTWKQSVLVAYEVVEAQENWWYLPDRRTLRVVANPNPQGGLTYLYDDVSERIRLEAEFNALTRVQTETLNSLKEGVAVFGSDGRIKLSNAAFADLWKLSPSLLAGQPHIDEIAALCRLFAPNDEIWVKIKGAVAGLHDKREPWVGRISRSDDSVLECAAAPLPDGAMLLTFADISSRIQAEQAQQDRHNALAEKNAALEEAARLRDDFVHHVSYELRSPLTNIIGFVQLLGDETVGPLNDKQRDYAGHIMRSSAALLAIINDILDLATIDQGALELSLEMVDIPDTIRAATKGLEDRLAESGLTLKIQAPQGIGSFVADSKRIRQILYNLLSNAIGFSERGQIITLSARKQGQDVVFEVRDQGRGIPQDIMDKVFNRFESHTYGSRHRGVGLGLSIVRSLVELHGGHITLDSKPHQGTCVTCFFPANGTPVCEAAE